MNISLTDRGPGISDSNAGWEKVWRSACWARLNNTEKAYYELRLAIDLNIGQSGLDLYAGGDPPTEPFQIDANFGYLGAVLSMLAVDLPGDYESSGSGNSEERVVVLGPAIPAAWKGGRVKGLRLRGGGSVNFAWNDNGVVDTVSTTGLAHNVRLVNVKGKSLHWPTSLPWWIDIRHGKLRFSTLNFIHGIQRMHCPPRSTIHQTIVQINAFPSSCIQQKQYRGGIARPSIHAYTLIYQVPLLCSSFLLLIG